MGDSTGIGFIGSSIVGLPPVGVEAREGESWPPIPKKLLKLTPEKLEEMRVGAIEAARFEEGSFFANPRRVEQLEHNAVIYQFAAEAVRRLQTISS